MPDEPSIPPRQITGDDIIAEIVRNSDAGQFKIRQTALVPSIFHIYLHPGDYDAIRAVIPALTAEARAALVDRLEALNRKARPSGFVRALGLDSAKPVEYKILDPDWTIEFHPDAEDKLGRGDLEVFSELASAPRPEFEGAMTRHVTRRQDGASTSHSEDAPTVQVRPAAGGEEWARIRYTTPAGAQVFPVSKNQVVIGRGGKSFWVDLKLEAPPDVSREHCRIRRDPATGQFLIRDVSQFGTTVNGKRIPAGADPQSGRQLDAHDEVPLPPRATIVLADVLTLEFEVVDS